ncbi:transglycosylase family protein [Collimonas pratensis]|uniref:Transglycosylase family protein n=1 Tax=Collimonas pratensis TaxID=279113 RepID=A0A127Q3N3_9BURK|nr:transglycosylase family protein [Collimonas pratensis]
MQGWPLATLLWLALSAAPAHALQKFVEVQQEFRSSEASLYDRKGQLLQQIRLNPHERRLSWVALEDVSPALRNALVASEDRRFYQHSGVDWNAVAAAAWGNLWNSRTRGASTITMQLAGLLDDDLRRRNSPRSFSQKLSQVMVAQLLERNWRKDQILEAYLNLVSFRGELVGIHALSRVLFGKHPGGLSQREAAIAVALIRGPMPRRRVLRNVPAVSCRSNMQDRNARTWKASPCWRWRAPVRIPKWWSPPRRRNWRRTWRASCCARRGNHCARRWMPACSASLPMRCSGSWRR